MVYYKLYDRNTLTLVDSGVVKDFNIDFDYMTNNSSTMNITEVSHGFKGDILAISEGVQLITLGVVTAIDNSDLKITFKHPKELLNDTVLNVFKFTNLLNKRFDGVQGLTTILDFAFVATADDKQKLPLDRIQHRPVQELNRRGNRPPTKSRIQIQDRIDHGA